MVNFAEVKLTREAFVKIEDHRLEQSMLLLSDAVLAVCLCHILDHLENAPVRVGVDHCDATFVSGKSDCPVAVLLFGAERELKMREKLVQVHVESRVSLRCRLHVQ